MRIPSRVGVVMVAAACVALSSCSADKKSAGSDRLQAQLKAFEEEANSAVAATMHRQQLPPEATARKSSSIVKFLEPEAPLWIQSGKSQVIRLPYPAKRVSIANPEVAGIVILGPDMFIINGKPLPEERSEEQRLLGSGVRAQSGGLFLGRTLTRPPQLLETTLIVWSDQGMSVHPVVVADFLDQQVMLEVTIAEVNRTALEEHGLDFRVFQNDLIAVGLMGAGAATGSQIQVPSGGTGLFPLTGGSGGPTYGLIFPDENVTVFLQALETEGLATILARPKLTAMSGQVAAFQAGGEIPIRISTALTTSLEFKPFGTIVNFIPQVMDNGDIFLTVTPEVSEADFSQLVDDTPSFRTRRASTTTRLQNGETLVVSGLLQSRIQEEEAGVPFLKDIPYLGYAFRGTRFNRSVVELMIVVKPTLIGALPAGADVPMPSANVPLSRDDVRTRFTSSEAPVTRPRPLPPSRTKSEEEAGADEVRSKSAPTEATEPQLPGVP